MKRFTTLVATLLALSLWAGSNQPAIADQGRNSTPGEQHHDPKSKVKPGQDRDHDSDRDHDPGNGKDDRHDPRDCDDARHDHGHGHPKPPKPPKPPKDPVGVPAVPTALTAEAVSLFQINLKWADNSTNELGFTIERSLDGKNFRQIAQTLPNTTVYRDLNRFPDTKYFYRARAFNAKGDLGYSKVVRLHTPAPKCELGLFGLGSVVLPEELHDLAAIAAGVNLSAVLQRDGSVVAWQHYLEATNLHFSNIVAIAAGYDHGLALSANGAVLGWGQNTFGQISIPPDLTNVVSVAAGYSHSLALRADGTVATWGFSSDSHLAVPIGLTGVVAIAAGNAYSLALRSDGTMVSWGMRLSRQWQNLDWLTNVVAIAAGENLASALHADGHVSTWTYDDRGAVPAPTDLTNAVGIASGQIWSVAIRANHSLASWGYQTLFGFPPTNLTGIVAVSLSGMNLLALTESPISPTRLTTLVLATNLVHLSWLNPSPTSESIRIQRATNVTWVDVGGHYALEGDWIDLISVPGDATNFEDTSTLTNQTYWYRLQAKNDCGTSLPGVAVETSIRPPIFQPSLYGQAFADKAILNFNTANNGSTGITIERAPDPDGLAEPWQIITTMSVTNLMLPFTNSGLALNSTYWYRAKESNGLGDSPYSIPLAVTITLPVPPTGVAAQIGSSNQIILSWYASGAGDQWGFQVERGMDLDGLPINWTEIGLTTNSATTSYHDQITGASGTTYWYRLRSFNSLGNSEYSQPISIQLQAPETPTISGQNLGTSAWLNWQLSYYAAGTRFELERTRGETGTSESWLPIASGTNLQDGGSLYGGYVDPGLIAGETYRYRVRISNWLGNSDYSSPVSVTILPPAAPSGISAYLGGSNYVTLSWWLNNIGTPSQIRIERALDLNFTPGAWTEIGAITNLSADWTYSAFFNDSNVVAGAAYWYRLRAADAAGMSDYSPPLRFQVGPPPTASPVYAGSFADSARLQWYYPASLYHTEGFKIQRATDQNGVPGEWTQIGILPANPTYNYDYNNYFTNTALTAGTYWYRIAPFNWGGDADYSTPTAVTIHPPWPGASLTALVGNTQQVVLKWFAPLLDDTDGVEVEHASDANGNPGAWSLLARHYRTNQSVIPNTFPIQPYIIVSNVLANTTNWYRLRSFNVLGYSTHFGPAEARTVQPPPPPKNLSARNQGTQISLNWSSSFDYGYVSEFELQRSPDSAGIPGDWTALATIPGGDPGDYIYNDTTLNASTQYWYRVRSRNWLGQSDFSAPVSVTVPPLPVPSMSKLLIGSSNKVELDLYANYYTYGQRGYRIERASDNGGAPGSWSDIGSVFSNFNGPFVRFTDSNVSAFTTNWYRARTIGLVGLSEASAARRIEITPPPPTYFLASAVANRVTLSWYISGYSDYGNVTGFQIERANDVNGSPGNWSRIGAATASGVYVDKSLAPTNGTYWYRLQAYNWIGAGDYATNRITIQPPNPPNSVSATVSTTNRVKITWYSQYPADQEGFKIERAPDLNGQPGTWMELGVFQDTGAHYHGFADTNVSPGAVYWYRVRSFTVIGDSLPSNLASARLTSPPVPSISATPFANRVNLFWDGDYYNYGLVEEFELERAADMAGAPGIWSKLATISGYTRNHVDTGLPPDAQVWYRIRARNWLGYSAYSVAVRAVIVPPAQPTSLAIRISQHPNHVVLRVGAAFTLDQESFGIDRAGETNEIMGPWEFQQAIPAANQWSADFVDTNALAFTTNWYRARAINAAGSSSNTYPVRLALLPPPAPDYFAANAFADQAQLSWSSSFPNYGQVTKFRIERAADNLGLPGEWKLLRAITNAAPDDPFAWQPGQSGMISVIDRDLLASQTYWYRIQAFNWIGEGDYTYPLSITITPPSAPTSLIATIGATNSSVELEWNPPTRGDQAGYLVERALDLNGGPGAWTEIATVTNYSGIFLPWIHHPRYSDPQVSGNQKLWYRVRAFNVVGYSDYTAPISISLQPPPEPILSYYSVMGARISLGWYGPSTFGYGTVAGYHLERAADLGNKPGNWTRIASIPTTSNQAYYEDNGLLAGKYWYRIQAYNWLGNGNYTSPISLTVIPPNPPLNLGALIGNTNQVQLNWYSAPPFDQDGFELEFAPDIGDSPGFWEPLATIAATNSNSAGFTQTNAIALATNWYRVRAFNRVGFSAYSQPLRFVVSPPAAPDYLSATAFADQARLQWSSYHYYNYGNLGGFVVERSVDLNGFPTDWTQVGLSPFDSYNYQYHSDSNLLAETTYWYRVRAFNWVGVSTNSPFAKVTIRRPAAPIFVNARIGATNRVNLSWSTSAPHDATIFFLERATDTGDGPVNWMQIGTQTNANYFNPFPDTNVIALTTNWYRIRALNAAGYSDYSAPVISRVLPPPAVNTIRQSRFANQVNFSFFSYLDSYGYLGSYKIERTVDHNGAPDAWEQIAAVPLLEYFTTYADSNLVAGVTYWYRVRASNWVGEGEYTSPTNFTISPPAQPTALYANVYNQSEISLWWYAGSPTDQDGFKLERSTDARNTWTELAVIPATNYYFASYVDTNFVANVTNYYRVRAFNVVGESPHSIVAQAIISLPNALTTPAVFHIESLTITNHDILISWTTPAGSTNLVEATTSLHNNFTPIGTPVIPNGTGNVTASFLDVGTLTNSTSRFYRIRIVK